MTRHPPAIVLGVDTPIGLTIMRELGEHGVPVYGIGRTDQSIGRASRYCTEFLVRPGTLFGPWLENYIIQTGAKALFAVSESDLVALSALAPVIQGCAILTPRAAPLAIVLDKNQTLRHAQAIGIDIPVSWQPVLGEDFKMRAHALNYPVIVKWADPPSIMRRITGLGFPFLKAEYIYSPEALLDLLFYYIPVGTWPLIQSYCPGFGLGQMFHIDKGITTLLFQHRRLHEWPPEGGASTLCIAEPLSRHQEQMALSERLLSEIGWDGPAMVEYRHDPKTGRYWLMEINGRYWGSLPLAAHHGASFAWEAYRRAILGQSDLASPSTRRSRARYMVPETRRLLRILFDRKAIADPLFKATPVVDIVNYILGFIDPRMRYFVFQWRDPGPFLSDIKTILKKAWQRGKQRRDLKPPD